METHSARPIPSRLLPFSCQRQYTEQTLYTLAHIAHSPSSLPFFDTTLVIRRPLTSNSKPSLHADACRQCTYVVTKRTHREKEREEERKDWQRGFAILYRENLCFNNYCDIGARVRKANQRRCVRVSGADGRTRPTDRQTGSESSGPDRGGTRRSRGCESLRGGCPLRQDGLLAFLHHRAATAPRLFASSSFARDASSRRATR